MLRLLIWTAEQFDSAAVGSCVNENKKIAIILPIIYRDTLYTYLYFIGEYIKDIDHIILPLDPILNNTIPLPIIERGHCGGNYEAFEEYLKEKLENNGELRRDCYGKPYEQPLSIFDSKVCQFKEGWMNFNYGRVKKKTYGLVHI